jgi:hypothetical protein
MQCTVEAGGVLGTIQRLKLEAGAVQGRRTAERQLLFTLRSA